MQFIVTGLDGADEGALTRRTAVREAHLAGVVEMKKAGKILFGTAILDDNEKMIGSVMVVEFADRAELDQWLKVEPYVCGDVWRKIEVAPCRVAPMFIAN
ncbi:YciI family protein [soil metagenome]